MLTSRWRIERCHRRRASGVRVKCDAGHTSLKPGLYFVRRSTQTLLRKRVYADTRVMWFILLLRRSPRVSTQTYAKPICVPFHGDGFILYAA